MIMWYLHVCDAGRERSFVIIARRLHVCDASVLGIRERIFAIIVRRLHVYDASGLSIREISGERSFVHAIRVVVDTFIRNCMSNFVLRYLIHIFVKATGTII